MRWNSYTNNRLICEHPSGFFIIKPLDQPVGQPIFCPVCECIMRTCFDDEAYEKFTCCEACSNKWVYTNSARRVSGWRPTKEEIIEKIS